MSTPSTDEPGVATTPAPESVSPRPYEWEPPLEDEGTASAGQATPSEPAASKGQATPSEPAASKGQATPSEPAASKGQATPSGPAEPSGTPTSSGPTTPSGLATPSPASPRRRGRRRWLLPVTAAAAFVVGIGAGGAGADPTSSQEYLALAAERDEAQGAIRAATARASVAEGEARRADEDAAAREGELDTREGELDAREAELDRREEAVDGREAAVTDAERREAANRVGNGVWTVGVDIEAGTYRTTEAVTVMCYWGIYRTGSNGADIIQNDIVTGGFPTVSLSAGQDFKSSDCGTWSKQ